MKNLLLLAAFAASSLAVSAQDDIVNMVVNGNFENPGYVQAVPSEYTWSPVDEWENLSVLPGWTLSTGGPWNGVICLITGEDNAGDGDLRPEEDENTLLFRGYTDNGWTSISAAQVVKNLVPGREYTLDFLIAQNQGEGSTGWTPDPDYGVTVSETDTDAAGEIIAGRQIMEATNMADGQDLTYVEYKFTAPASGEIYLYFYMQNKYGEKNKKDNLWMELDLVRIYSEEGDEEAPDSSVAEIFDANAPVEYYNLQGVRVNNAENGIFIRKQGNKTTKVIL